MNSNIGLSSIRNSKTEFLDNANKTSVFVTGWIYAEGSFVITGSTSLFHHPNNWLTCRALIAHSGWVIRVAMAIAAIIAGRVSNSKIWNLLVFCLDRKTTKQQNDETTNDETTYLGQNGSFVDRTVIRERFLSVNDHFFVSDGSFVVSLFWLPVSSKA